MQITKAIENSNVSRQDQFHPNTQKPESERVSLQHDAKSRKRTYQWSDEQNKKYYSFLVTLKKMNALEQQRVRIRYINIKMSAFIRTRTSNQCRSHHQKMLSRFGSYDNIISHFQTYFLRKDSISDHNKVGNESQQPTPGLKNSCVQVLGSQNNILNWPITAWDVEYAFQGRRGIEIVYQ